MNPQLAIAQIHFDTERISLLQHEDYLEIITSNSSYEVESHEHIPFVCEAVANDVLFNEAQQDLFSEWLEATLNLCLS